MSQHPIDDLFSSQLRDHRVKPERATWEELQRRMNAKEERKSPFVWWYASAASVAVLLLASWWLWSGDETVKTDPATTRIAKQTPRKSVPGQKPIPSKTDLPSAMDEAEKPVIAFEKPAVRRSNSQNEDSHQVVKRAPHAAEELVITEKPPISIPQEEVRKPEVLLAAEETPKQAERTLVVQMAAPEIKPTALVASTESENAAFTERNGEDQPKKKRFRLGRVLRQFNKIKSGEPVEWEEVGVQPGALLARASERVQEGKEKISNSYENLRYNAFKKNPNNK
ncbi:hypothetical protein [Larkinella humicola]|uniref:Uncharacterized protein n=1 Tax=Larkinella humicola TaxID=2607654 RepID=A0A5N1JL96_9BACT|nr:hypothetical protein [Larkinella humicola]KAA9353824.1 hypothetical protein F0P93_14475 [Larkinella humicola]